jgi:hypothetical protein
MFRNIKLYLYHHVAHQGLPVATRRKNSYCYRDTVFTVFFLFLNEMGVYNKHILYLTSRHVM